MVFILFLTNYNLHKSRLSPKRVNLIFAKDVELAKKIYLKNHRHSRGHKQTKNDKIEIPRP